MKKIAMYIVFVCVLILGACADEQKNQKEDSTTSDEAQHSKTEEKTTTEDEQTDETTKNEEEDEEEEETAQEPLYELNDLWAFTPIDDAEEKAVLITIDDAPDKYALDMAKTLEKLDVPAIFFVNGHFLQTEEEQETLKEIHEMGFAIGNHTKTHPNLKTISESQQKEEIVSVSDDVEKIIGERPIFFRPPHGIYTDYAKDIIRNEGMLAMNWTYGYDWEAEYQNKDALADIMVNTPYLNNGGNLLMHDREWTNEALEDIILGLQEKGYDFIDPKTIKGLEE